MTYAFLIAYPGIAVVAVTVPLLVLRWFFVPSARKHTEWMLVAATLAEPAGALAEGIANWISRLDPLKYDLYIYQFDHSIGDPGFHIAQFVDTYRWAHILVSVSYGLLPAAMFGVFCVNLLHSEAEALRVARALLYNVMIAPLLYLLFPVCGPRFAFPSFPNLPVDVFAHPIAIAAAPNGVPSVHTSSALLILWFLRRSTYGKATGSVFLTLTVLATLGSGQHYVFDLLAALPYSLAIVALTNVSVSFRKHQDFILDNAQ